MRTTSLSRNSRNGSNQTFSQQKQQSFVLTLNRLKQTQDKIHQRQMRLNAIDYNNLKMQSKNLDQLRRSEAKNEVRRLMDDDRRTQQQDLMRRSFNIERHHDRALKERISHHKKIQELQNMMQTQNQWNYQRARKQRVQHQKQIKKQRLQQLFIKQKSRQKQARQQHRRLKLVQQFKQSYGNKTRRMKQQEIAAINKKIKQRNRYLASLQQREMRASRYRQRVNPEDILLSRSSQSSLDKPGTLLAKNYSQHNKHNNSNNKYRQENVGKC